MFCDEGYFVPAAFCAKDALCNDYVECQCCSVLRVFMARIFCAKEGCFVQGRFVCESDILHSWYSMDTLSSDFYDKINKVLEKNL